MGRGHPISCCETSTAAHSRSTTSPTISFPARPSSATSVLSGSRVAPVHAAGASDPVLLNVNTGAFEVYDIANNQLTGAASLGSVGLDWQLGGFAADPPTGSMGGSGSTSQLVQALAGFGGGSGAADSLNTTPLGADTSQQQFLTTPQHA